MLEVVAMLGPSEATFTFKPIVGLLIASWELGLIKAEELI